MKDKGSRDACRNGNDSAPSPIRKNAESEYNKESQYDDFDKGQRHRAAPSLRRMRLCYHRMWAGPARNSGTVKLTLDRLGRVIDPGPGHQEQEQGTCSPVSSRRTAAFPPTHDGLTGRVVDSPIPPRPASSGKHYFEHQI
jgi:hypothetical protein